MLRHHRGGETQIPSIDHEQGAGKDSSASWQNPLRVFYTP